MRIYLIGPMASGKSTVGKALAERLGVPFADTDQLIVDAHGPIAQIFARHGEAHFRDLEEQTLAVIEHGVIATGGGAVLREANRRRLATGAVIYLQLDEATAAQRIRGDSVRPLLAGDDALTRWKTLLAEREETYQSVADLRIQVAGRGVQELAERIEAQLQTL